MNKVINFFVKLFGMSTVDHSQANVDIEMVFVEGGTFTMGWTPEQGKDERDKGIPPHEVTLSDYNIGKYEVTQAQWKAVMGKKNNPSWFKGNQLPVEMVNYEEVQEFINLLNQKTGKNYRLPTEAEWEYAARGGKKSKGYKYSGSNEIKEVAWYLGNSDEQTHPVGEKLANELGIYDMTGNVREWCSDRLDNYSTSPQTNPQGPSYGYYRIVRGGCWIVGERNMRTSHRDNSPPHVPSFSLGFRLAHSVEKDSPTVVNSQAKVELEMVLVDGGTFTMGYTPEQGTDYRGREKPAHEVTLSNYYIGKYEVTQAQWESVMGKNNNPSKFKEDNMPVTDVSWKDAQKFIVKLNQKTGKNYRLPTEAEWEYAARGGNKSKGYRYSGSNNVDEVAWYHENAGYKAHPVGTKLPNELGIYDMSGNVYEWCNDWYEDYSKHPQTNPQGPLSGVYRVVRGGSWFSAARDIRLSLRCSQSSNVRSGILGFRLAHSIE